MPIKKTIAVTLVAGLAIGGAAVAETHGPAGQSQRAAPTTSRTATIVRAHSARQSHEFRGTVTSSNRAHGWFWMHTTTNKSVQIHTNHGTRWDNCDWGELGHGHHVDVHAYRSHGTWIAWRMQNWHGNWDNNGHGNNGNGNNGNGNGNNGDGNWNDRMMR
jgi:hypothetical protein